MEVLICHNRYGITLAADMYVPKKGYRYFLHYGISVFIFLRYSPGVSPNFFLNCFPI